MLRADILTEVFHEKLNDYNFKIWQSPWRILSKPKTREIGEFEAKNSGQLRRRNGRIWGFRPGQDKGKRKQEEYSLVGLL